MVKKAMLNSPTQNPLTSPPPRMNKMNTGKGRFLEQIRTVAEKIGPENERPIKTKTSKRWSGGSASHINFMSQSGVRYNDGNTSRTWMRHSRNIPYGGVCMLRRAFIIAVALASIVALGAALSAGPAWAGDFDLMLKDINLEAEADMGGYKASLAVDFGASDKTISLLLEKERMRPGDAYMALKVSRVSGKPIEAVVGEFKRSKGQGWGAIAKNLGIKPGSAEFHALKERGGKGKDKAKGQSGGKPGGKKNK